MKKILESISELMIVLKEFELPKHMIQNKWFGNIPANSNEIKKAEGRLKIQLPSDYLEFIKICNGFHAFNTVEPTFHSIDQIQYLQDIDPKLIQIWEHFGIDDVAKHLKKSIIVAGIQEEQSFLLIPPESQNNDWKYWKFAAWIPGEEPYSDLTHYFNEVLAFMISQIQE